LNIEKNRDSFYKRVLESLEDYAVFTTDMEGLITTWNEGAYHILGFREEEIIGKSWEVIFTPTDIEAKAPQREMSQAVNNGRGLDERYHLRKNGDLFWASGLVFPLLDDDEKQIGFTKILRDLSERKIAEQKLADSRRFAEGIIATSRIPLIILTKDFHINSVNASFYKTFKVRANQTLGKSIFDINKNSWDTNAIKKLLNGLKNRKNVSEDHEVELLIPGLGQRQLLFNARKLYLQSADFNEMILVSIEDITEKKLLDQQKDDFITTASHELKTPVTTIKANAQLALRKAMEQPDSFFLMPLDAINKQIDKLGNLINQLLDMSKIQTDRIALDITEFDILEMIQEINNDIKVIYPNRLLIVGGKRVMVQADKIRLGQVLTNVISNAFKFSPGAMPVEVSIIEDKLKENAVISIKDCGLGIPKAEQPKLFKRFFRSANTKSISGFGLGLSISLQIMTKHHGAIWFESKENKGTTFYIKLPVLHPKNVSRS